ncbi:MAG: TldD/PmbA family protein [Methanomassiliicoccaceae archaeon]|nr:TldD/PmbA family protein [Methanomassiliicoccaceae archaeon]
MNVNEAAAEALRHAKADHAESYVIMSVTRSAYIDGSRISNIETKTDAGISVRVASGNRLGRACATLNDTSSAGRCAETAVKVSSFSPKNDGFKGYPMPSRPAVSVKDIFDKKIDNITDRELKDLLSAVIGACGCEIPRGILRLSSVRSAIANSNGLLAEHSGTMMYGHFTSMHRGRRNGEGTESLYGTSLSADPERIGGELERKAKESASAEPFAGKEVMTMVLPPCELGDMIISSVGSAVNGENIFYKRSPWTEKMNEKVASDILTIVDDPTVPGPLCSEFDDEGSPATKKVLVENGIFRRSIHDSFIGQSTGNGIRRDPTDAQNVYSAAVSVKPMNLIVSPGRYSLDDIVSQTDNGILVEKFAWPEADPLTGRFGLEVRCGHLIRNGRITETVNNALLMGNMFDALANIELIGRDAVNTGHATVPAMSFSGTELAGN